MAELKQWFILFCLLIITVQCALPAKSKGPEVINCATDEIPIELQGIQKKESVIFTVTKPDKVKVIVREMYAFDLLTASNKLIAYQEFPFHNEKPILSPLETNFVFREYIRTEETSGEIIIHERPVIKVIETQVEIPIPLEITSDDALGWSPDGKCLVVMSSRNPEMTVYHLSNGQYQQWSLQQGFWDEVYFSDGSLSPDGRWLVGECGRHEICVMKVNGEIIYQHPINIARPKPAALFRWSSGSNYLILEEGDWEVSYLEVGANWSKQPLINAANCQEYCESYASLFISDWSSDELKIIGGTRYPNMREFQINFPAGTVLPLTTGLDLPFVFSPDGRRMSGVRLRDTGFAPSGVYIIDLGGEMKLVKELDLLGSEVGEVLFWTSSD